jgi:hypothetical protein
MSDKIEATPRPWHKSPDKDTPGDTAWRLIMADKPDEIARIEAEYGQTQAATVEDFIERSCWTETVPDFVGGKGTPRERLLALRAAYMRENPGGSS